MPNTTAEVVFRKRTKASKLSALRDVTKTTRHYRIIDAIFVSMCNSTLFKDMDFHDESDWIVNHHTDEQTFNDWSRSYHGIKSSKSTIFIQPIGAFTGPGMKLLSWLQCFCSAFYYGLQVTILPAIAISGTKCKMRINPEYRRCQLHAADIIEYLKKNRNSHAICTVAVTIVDLYPRDSWNFVFGLASLTNGVGVFSFARYIDTFYTELTVKDSLDNYQTYEVNDKLLWRACKVMSHEIGHMFGIHHCVYYNCAMNGSNHLSESDRRMPNLCPICLRKLQEALKFDLVDRYKALSRFCEGHSTEGQPPLNEFTGFGTWLQEILKFLDLGQYKTKVTGRPR